MEEVEGVTPLLTMRGIYLHMKGTLYATCMGNAMLYGSETCLVKDNDWKRLESTDNSMVR